MKQEGAEVVAGKEHGGFTPALGVLSLNPPRARSYGALVVGETHHAAGVCSILAAPVLGSERGDGGFAAGRDRARRPRAGGSRPGHACLPAGRPRTALHVPSGDGGIGGADLGWRPSGENPRHGPVGRTAAKRPWRRAATSQAGPCDHASGREPPAVRKARQVTPAWCPLRMAS